MTDRRPDLPTIEADSKPFWDAMHDSGTFLVAVCGSCGKVHHYPRPFCPFCWSDDVTLVPATGIATLYTYSTVYLNDLPPFSGQLPYVAAVVELEEGPRVMTRVINCDPTQLSIGMRLRMVATPLTDEVTVPDFEPATS